MSFKPGTYNSWKIILILFSAITLAGCTTVQFGQDFKLQTFTTHAEQGKTNKEQILKLLGKPMGTGVSQEASGERFDEWSYYFGTGQLPKMKDAKIKILQIRFNNNGTIRSYNWTNS